MAKSSKKKTTRKKIKTYAFVDTNIFLDFYRGKSEASLKLLEKLETVKDRIICTYQVEMEFLKNRQNQINRIITDTELGLNAQLPAVISSNQLHTYLNETKKEIAKKKTALKKSIQKLLKSPKSHDRVYKVLETIFHSESDHVLTRDMKIRHQIKRKAWRRFVLGYPPRKSGDTSIGDALNWEWFIHCAQELKGRFVLISRDNDFGCKQAGECFLNDQLRQEFVDRVGHKPLIYTQQLSAGLKELEVQVTEQEEKEEEGFSSTGSVISSIGQSASGSTVTGLASIQNFQKLYDQQNTFRNFVKKIEQDQAPFKNDVIAEFLRQNKNLFGK